MMYKYTDSLRNLSELEEPSNHRSNLLQNHQMEIEEETQVKENRNRSNGQILKQVSELQDEMIEEHSSQIDNMVAFIKKDMALL